MSLNLLSYNWPFVEEKLFNIILLNVSNKCFGGPVRQNNLMLILCPNIKKVANRDILENFFKNEQAFLCHKAILSTFDNNEVGWLGFPWTDTSRLSFARRHRDNL